MSNQILYCVDCKKPTMFVSEGDQFADMTTVIMVGTFSCGLLLLPMLWMMDKRQQKFCSVCGCKHVHQVNKKPVKKGKAWITITEHVDPRDIEVLPEEVKREHEQGG